LNDFFRDLTDPILYTEGEVYQYVGDEIIVS
ncbi:MAG: adenylate cyclase, partial [Saprospiraceae bacterium]